MHGFMDGVDLWSCWRPAHHPLLTRDESLAFRQAFSCSRARMRSSSSNSRSCLLALSRRTDAVVAKPGARSASPTKIQTNSAGRLAGNPAQCMQPPRTPTPRQYDAGLPNSLNSQPRQDPVVHAYTHYLEAAAVSRFFMRRRCRFRSSGSSTRARSTGGTFFLPLRRAWGPCMASDPICDVSPTTSRSVL